MKRGETFCGSLKKVKFAFVVECTEVSKLFLA